MLKCKDLYLLLMILFFIVILQSCTNHYGNTSEKWAKLTEQEKVEAKNDYNVVINSRIEQDHTDVINARTRGLINHGARH